MVIYGRSEPLCELPYDGIFMQGSHMTIYGYNAWSYTHIWVYHMVIYGRSELPYDGIFKETRQKMKNLHETILAKKAHLTPIWHPSDTHLTPTGRPPDACDVLRRQTSTQGLPRSCSNWRGWTNVAPLRRKPYLTSI